MSFAQFVERQHFLPAEPVGDDGELIITLSDRNGINVEFKIYSKKPAINNVFEVYLPVKIKASTIKFNKVYVVPPSEYTKDLPEPHLWHIPTMGKTYNDIYKIKPETKPGKWDRRKNNKTWRDYKQNMLTYKQNMLSAVNDYEKNNTAALDFCLRINGIINDDKVWKKVWKEILKWAISQNLLNNDNILDCKFESLPAAIYKWAWNYGTSGAALWAGKWADRYPCLTKNDM